MASATKRIMTLAALLSGRITHASQDGSREFISLLACICANGTALPPALIYKGDSGTLQDTWVEDWEPENEAFFAVTANGWSCDALGLNWLKTVFQRCTSKKAGNRRRLLIVDGHSSHVNMSFIDTCDQLRILLLILPPHSTHRLQPLDVSLFAPLSTHYTNSLNKLMFNSYGIVGMSKRQFWSCFLPAWKASFTEKNIESAFRKTGIFPYNPALVLDVITIPAPIEAPIASGTLKMPLTCRAVRRMQRAYADNPSPTKLKKIFRANERLAAEQDISRHVIRGLTEALQDEKKRRKRGKRLNLLGVEDGGPQFFSPTKVQAARDFQATKEAEEALRRLNINEKKVAAAAKKEEKEKEKERKREVAAEGRAAKAAERQVQKEAKEAAKQHDRTLSLPQRQSTKATRAPMSPKEQSKQRTVAVVVEEEEVVCAVTSRGRQTRKPKHLL